MSAFHSPEIEPVVLVVDDERVMRDGCVRICQALGCKVESVGNGEACLAFLREEAVDVLLLDLMMPGVSGMEVLEGVQSHFADLVVVVITGYATVELAVEAMKKGAYDFISKPFTPDQLRLVISRALERRRLQLEAQRLKEERARSLRDIAEEQSRLRTVIYAMADGVIVTDQSGIIVLHNPSAGRLLSRGDLPLLNLPIAEVAPKEVVEMVHKLMNEPPGTARSVELSLEGVGDVRAHASPIHLSGKGDVLGSVMVIQDITTLKEIDRMKSEFVATVSHELRSPLGAIHQQLEVLGKGMAGEITEKQHSLLNRAQQRVEGLLALTNDLLDLARIEAGRVIERREPLHLNPPLDATVEFYTEMAEREGLALIRHPSPHLPLVAGDTDALQEVFSNLIANAIAYTPSGGRISVRTGTRAEYVWVEVEDTGPGIPPDAMTKIFERFYRVKNETTRHIVGTGLGLPIVKSIVEAHMGDIEVESELGKGSKFRVLFPQSSISLESPAEMPETDNGTWSPGEE